MQHSSKPVHVIVPLNVLLKTAACLFVLTLLTMIAFWYRENLGAFAAPVAFAIAAVKATLVMMFFMGLKYDSMMNRIIFGLGFFFLALLYIICILDIYTRVGATSTL